ncbi:hypothetical protein QE193_19000 [Arsenophonus nasoniae]|uniref:YD repeat-containing protein n=2 Tax=Arsenophonus nasoniae TaxID=638 RepID=D2U3B2_9GAMM|nr:hypothetical protein [Arsenophonus nasoniae]QBY41579.1 hypothetical protein ArsFIN_00970 [Arsenophonus nasoniae]WGM05784.1 hypothetical protein QE258_20495 [Arsenophonus nasoniae]WGM15502.1 hypothetical protein QE193_19000 [Arsenophonus nasoniae]CBA75769.1 YD repeat-containing protein [Arsenophonus nasoniae]
MLSSYNTVTSTQNNPSSSTDVYCYYKKEDDIKDINRKGSLLQNVQSVSNTANNLALSDNTIIIAKAKLIAEKPAIPVIIKKLQRTSSKLTPIESVTQVDRSTSESLVKIAEPQIKQETRQQEKKTQQLLAHLKKIDLIDESIEAVGLNNIKISDPMFGQKLELAFLKVKEGVNFVNNLFSNELSALEKQAIQQEIVSYFRDINYPDPDTDKSIINLVKIHIKKFLAFVNRYSPDKIISVKENKKDNQKVAWIYENDPEFCIFMTNSAVHEYSNAIAWNFIHELSHISLKTKDFWYIVSVPPPSKIGAVGFDSFAGKIDVLTRMQTINYRKNDFLVNGPDYENTIFSVFNSRCTYLKAETILNNADSIAMLLFFVNQKFNGPLAALTTIPNYD